MSESRDDLIEEVISDPTYDILPDGTIWARKPLSGPISPTKTYPLRRFDRKRSDNDYYEISHYGKFLRVHRIIYRKFNGTLDPNLTINHVDGDKTNNKPGNLELITIQKNLQHAADNNLTAKGEKNGSSILTESEVKQIKKLLDRGNYTHKQIGRMFNVSRSAITDIKNNNKWKHIK